jgi:very-short-patch-repair endonuclease
VVGSEAEKDKSPNGSRPRRWAASPDCCAIRLTPQLLPPAAPHRRLVNRRWENCRVGSGGRPAHCCRWRHRTGVRTSGVAARSYAERGGKTGGTLTGKGADSDFEVSVAERLRRRGYSVETQVGVSGYKVDLGIRHPDHPNRFIVGVECDGAAYHSSKSVRDRDRLREEILRELGWAIIRVWSTDWFDNPGVQTDRLVAAIEELRRRPVLQYEEYRAETISEPQSLSESIGETVSEIHSRNTEAEIKSHSLNGASPSSAAHVAKKGRLTREEVFNQLRQFRENVIAKEMDGCVYQKPDPHW